MRETELVAACIKLLRSVGVCCWRQNVTKTMMRGRWVRFGFPGLSDIIGWLPDGRFLAVECKVGKNTLSKVQRDFLDLLNRSGGLGVAIWDSTNGLAQVVSSPGATILARYVPKVAPKRQRST